jgi:hypothetical protein
MSCVGFPSRHWFILSQSKYWYLVPLGTMHDTFYTVYFAERIRGYSMHEYRTASNFNYSLSAGFCLAAPKCWGSITLSSHWLLRTRLDWLDPINTVEVESLRWRQKLKMLNLVYGSLWKWLFICNNMDILYSICIWRTGRHTISPQKRMTTHRCCGGENHGFYRHLKITVVLRFAPGCRWRKYY